MVSRFIHDPHCPWRTVRRAGLLCLIFLGIACQSLEPSPALEDSGVGAGRDEVAEAPSSAQGDAVEQPVASVVAGEVARDETGAAEEEASASPPEVQGPGGGDAELPGDAGSSAGEPTSFGEVDAAVVVDAGTTALSDEQLADSGGPAGESCAGRAPPFDHGISMPGIGQPLPAEDPRQPGQGWPAFWLQNVEPDSCGHGKVYGSADVMGDDRGGPDVVLVVLLASWCPYCRGQASRLEAMRLRLAEEGLELEVLAINEATDNAVAQLQGLLDQARFAVLQDVPDLDVWGLHQGKKDDMFIYDRDGVLQAFFSTGGPLGSNLSTPEGALNVETAIRGAAGR